MNMKRRQFLGSALAGTTGAVVSGTIPQQSQAADTDTKPKGPISTDPTAWVPFGEKLTVPRLGIGTGMRGWERESNLTRQGEKAAIGLLQFAYDEGVRLLDGADLYGIHPYVAKAWKDKPRDSYAIVSKIWFGPNGLPEKERPDSDVVVKRFLKELNTDYIDILQIHCQSKADWPDEFQRQMEILQRLKEEGLIRAHGVSCHGNPALETAAKTDWVDSVHVRINPQGVRMAGPADETVPLVKKVHEAGKGVIGMKIVGEGAFTPEQVQKSIEYVTTLDCVDVMICGYQNREQITTFKNHVGDALKKQAEVVG